jgi:hypothetical protein
MRRLILALSALAICAFAAVPIAFAQSHHRHHGDRNAQFCERHFHFKLTKANRNRDADHDGMTNAAECAHKANPAKPNNRTASAATVKSFTPATATADAVLVILLPDGTTTETGKVTDQTEIHCVTAAPAATTPTTPTTPAMSSRHDGGDDNGGGDDNDRGDRHGGGDNSGPGSDSSAPGRGDDNGDANDDNDNDENNAAACTTADLTVGAVIHEAQLRVDPDNGASFREIVIVKSA